MGKKILTTGIIGYEKIIAGKIFGKWTVLDKELEKKLNGLSEKERNAYLNKMMCS